jgi:hypothetical protein
MCFVRISEQTATFALNNIKVLFFITEVESVYCAVRAESLHKKGTKFVFKGLIIYIHCIEIYSSFYTSVFIKIMIFYSYDSFRVGFLVSFFGKVCYFNISALSSIVLDNCKKLVLNVIYIMCHKI